MPADLPTKGRSASTGKLVTPIFHVGGFSFFVFLNPWASILKLWMVFCFGNYFLFKSILAGCGIEIRLQYAITHSEEQNNCFIQLASFKTKQNKLDTANFQLFRDSTSMQAKVFLKNPMPISKVLRAPCICLKVESFDLLGMVLYHHFHFEN